MSNINYSPISKPFVVSAVILSFVGVSIGSFWMFTLFGLSIPQMSGLFQIHKTIQLDGFLTLLVMGVSYMIIPRFRNVNNPSTRLTFLSFGLIISSIFLELSAKLGGLDLLQYAIMSRIVGILIFAGLSYYIMKTSPKLLKETDYFFAISISMLTIIHILPLVATVKMDSLNQIQVWFLFPILTIFGVEYKTLPSFFGFMRPRRNFTILCIITIILSCILGLTSLYYDNRSLDVAFNATFILCVVLFVLSLFVYGGFDNKEIVKMMPSEKKARYDAIRLHTRIGFVFLVAGFLCGVAFYVDGGFLYYDLAIHYVAIGFIGITIMLFFPLMLPPIIGKSVNFLKLNKIPLVLILSALAMRTMGDIVIHTSTKELLTPIFGTSGLVVLAAMFFFVKMIHESTNVSINIQK